MTVEKHYACCMVPAPLALFSWPSALHLSILLTHFIGSVPTYDPITIRAPAVEPQSVCAYRLPEAKWTRDLKGLSRTPEAEPNGR